MALVFFGGVGFFSAVSEASRISPRFQVQYKKSQALGWLQTTQYTASVLPKIICMKLRKSEYVPDEKRIADQVQHDLACPWARSTAELFAKIPDGALPNRAELKLVELDQNVNDEYILEIKRELDDSIDRYITARAIFEKFEKKLEPKAFEVVLSFFSPYFISFAIGFSVLKAVFQ